MLCGCSNDGESGGEEESVAIAFSQPQTAAVTRASLNDIHDDFGVIAYKETSLDPFMSNVRVYYDEGEWSYSPESYWDYETDSTAFYAYSPYTTTGSKITSGYDKTVEFLYGHKTVQKADYGKPVDLVLDHINAQVCLEFCTDISDYRVDIADSIRLVPTVAYTSGYNDVIISRNEGGRLIYSQAVTSDKTLAFAAPKDSVNASSTDYIQSPTTYYAAPQATAFDATSANVNFTVSVPLSLTPLTAEHSTPLSYTAIAMIPAYTGSSTSAVNLTQWLSGRRYVYRFNISKESISLVTVEVYKPDIAGHQYVLESSTTISTGDEDPGRPADAKPVH